MDINRNVEQPYWNTLHKVAEHLSDKELDERMEMYEDARERREQMSPVKGLFHDIFIGMPLVLDGINPLVDTGDAYSAVVQVRDYRREE